MSTSRRLGLSRVRHRTPDQLPLEAFARPAHGRACPAPAHAPVPLRKTLPFSRPSPLRVPYGYRTACPEPIRPGVIQNSIYTEGEATGSSPPGSPKFLGSPKGRSPGRTPGGGGAEAETFA